MKFRTALAVGMIACAVVLAVTLVASADRGDPTVSNFACVKGPKPDTKICLVGPPGSAYGMVCLTRPAGHGRWQVCGPGSQPNGFAARLPAPKAGDVACVTGPKPGTKACITKRGESYKVECVARDGHGAWRAGCGSKLPPPNVRPS